MAMTKGRLWSALSRVSGFQRDSSEPMASYPAGNVCSRNDFTSRTSPTLRRSSSTASAALCEW